jgi:hypothetical protein
MTITSLAIIAMLAFTVINTVSAISFTIYSDNACATKAANPVAGMSNPTLAPVNACFKSFTVDTTTYYNKVTQCNSANTSSISYSDVACSVCPRGPCAARTIPTGTCIPSVGIPAVGSYRIACDVSAASHVAAAAALWCVAMIVAALM